MKKLLLLLTAVSAAFAAPTATFIGATATQALVAIRGATGDCTLILSESPSGSPLVPDVDATKYSGSSTDAGRADTVTWADNTRIVILGHMYNDRALGAVTPYYLSITGCGTTATLRFSTSNLSTGSQGWAPPWADDRWGKQAWPMTANMLLTKGIHNDPLTGLRMAQISGPLDLTAIYPGANQTAAPASGTLAFAYVDKGVGWTNPQTITDGASSTASTTNTNPVDLYPGVEGNGDNGWAAWLLWSWNDIGAALWGQGSDATQGNRDFTICIFLNPATGCADTPITIHPTVGGGYTAIASSSSDIDHPFPDSFPNALFAGWGANSMIGVDKRFVGQLGNGAIVPTISAVSGVLTIAGVPNFVSHFPTTLAAGHKIWIQDSSATCTNSLCTIVSVEDAMHATISESLTSSGKHFGVLQAGIRVQKANATGTLTVGARYKLAGAVNLNMGGGAENTVCNQNQITTGDGHEGYLCTVILTTSIRVWWFLGNDGTNRFVYGGRAPASSYFTGLIGTNGFVSSDDFLNAINLNALTMAPSPDDGRTWLVWGLNNGGTGSLYSIHYDGDFTEARDWNYTLSPMLDGYIQHAPSDNWTWTCLVDSTHGLVAQITAHPEFGYNSTLYGNGWSMSGISGTTVYFQNIYNGGQDTPAWLALVDANTGLLTNMIHTMDGTGTNGYVRFGGLHNATPTATYSDNVAMANHAVGLGDTSKLFGGPFEMPVTGVMRSGVWSTNNCLDWPGSTACGVTVPDATCPTPNTYVTMFPDAPCVTIRVPKKGWCSISPRSDEISAYPCHEPTTPISGWTPASYSAPFVLRVGDDVHEAGVFGDAEQMRVIDIDSTGEPGCPGTSEPNDCQWKVVLQRNAMPDYCCIAPGPVAGSICTGAPSQFYHPNGWVAIAYSGNLAGCSVSVYSITGKTEATTLVGDLGRTYLQGHGEIVAGTEAGSVTVVTSGGIPIQKPIDTVFGIPMGYNIMGKPNFHNPAMISPPTGSLLDIGSNQVQSYTRAVSATPWYSDSNTINTGACPECFGQNYIGSRSLHATATPNVYRLEVIGPVDYKLYSVIATAGHYNLKDVSGPASDVTATPYTWCDALANDECISGSTAGQAFVYVPNAYDGNACSQNQHYVAQPCLISGQPGIGMIRRQGWTHSDPFGKTTQQLTYLNDLPGAHYPYATFMPVSDKLASGFATFLAGWGQVLQSAILPPWRETSEAANDFILVPVKIPSGDTYAEVRFGYSRFGLPSEFKCTARAESCNTSGTPYNFEFETRTPTSCASGCTINIPTMAPNIVSYQVFRSPDGSAWTADGDIQFQVVR